MLLMVRVSNSYLKEHYSLQTEALNAFLKTWSGQLIVYDKKDLWDGGYICPALNKSKSKSEFLEDHKVMLAFLYDFFETHSVKNAVIIPLNKCGYCTDKNKLRFIDTDFFNSKNFDIGKRYAVKINVNDERDTLDALIRSAYNYPIEFAIVSDETDCVIIPSHHFDYHFVNYYNYSQSISELIKVKYKSLCIDRC